ncbi:MAG: (d)CMP kinase [Bacillota bacterium]
MNRTIKIAIDGPAGAGKSSVAKILAEKLGYIYIDTGAMYRAITYKIIKEKINLHNNSQIKDLINQTIIEFNNSHGFSNQRIFCDGIDVTQEIRSPQVTDLVSKVASLPEIRGTMVKLQQRLGSLNNVVMDGRDIGTVVMPEAEFKFYLTASIEERAKRRAVEMKNKGYLVNDEQILNDISNRDKADSQRDVSPLKPADDALIIDTSCLSLQQVVDKLLSIIQKRGV